MVVVSEMYVCGTRGSGIVGRELGPGSGGVVLCLCEL